MPERPHILFVCGRNQWRSPTAVQVYLNDPRIEVRSAGVSEQSPHRISERDLAWADLVLVMERKHRSRILDRFRGVTELPPIQSLDIPDAYGYLDPELVELIAAAAEPFIPPLCD